MNKYSLFFIDDDLSYVNLIRHNLPAVGPWRVFTTHETSLAMEKLQRESFDIYVIDLKLRDHVPSNTLNGDDLYIALKDFSTFSVRSPVVFYTESIQRSQVAAIAGPTKSWARVYDYYELPRQQQLKDLSTSLLEIMRAHEKSHSNLRSI
jgi:DNA-binding NtrC family response regulator